MSIKFVFTIKGLPNSNYLNRYDWSYGQTVFFISIQNFRRKKSSTYSCLCFWFNFHSCFHSYHLVLAEKIKIEITQCNIFFLTKSTEKVYEWSTDWEYSVTSQKLKNLIYTFLFTFGRINVILGLVHVMLAALNKVGSFRHVPIAVGM